MAYNLETMTDDEINRLTNEQLRQAIITGRRKALNRQKTLEANDYFQDPRLENYSNTFKSVSKDFTPSKLKENNQSQLRSQARFIRRNLSSGFGSSSKYLKNEYENLSRAFSSIDETIGSRTTLKQVQSDHSYNINGVNYSREDVKYFYGEVRRVWGRNESSIKNKLQSKYESNQLFSQMVDEFYLSDEYQSLSPEELSIKIINDVIAETRAEVEAEQARYEQRASNFGGVTIYEV